MGTRSALTVFTVATLPPSDSGSYGTQVQDPGAVVPGHLDDLRAPYRDSADVVHGDGAGIVGERVSGGSADPAQGGIQAGDQARHGLIPHRDLYPEPGPRQPGRRTATSAAASHPGPAPAGPLPRSTCNQSPGSVIHGR